MNIVLLVIMRLRMGSFQLGGMVVSMLKLLVASAVGGAVAEFTSHAITNVIDISNIAGSFIALIIVGAVGLTVIFIMCRILDVQEVTGVVSRVKSRFKRR